MLGKVTVFLALGLPGCSFAIGYPTGKWTPEREADCERLPWEAPVDAALGAAIFTTLWWTTEEIEDSYACPPECDAQDGIGRVVGYAAAFLSAVPFVASSLESLTWERRCRARFRKPPQTPGRSVPPVPPARERCAGWFERLRAAESPQARERRFEEMPRECRSAFRKQCAPHYGAPVDLTPRACLWLFSRR